MRRRFEVLAKWLAAGLLVALATLTGAPAATANTIFVSGDGNVTNYLGVDPGNDQFFTNILQGGSSVAVQSTTTGLTAPTDLNNFYNGLSGVSSSIILSPSAAALTGVDLFIGVAPLSYNAAEIAAMQHLLLGGGSIAFLGDHDGFAVANANINSALSALGSSLSIVDARIDVGGRHIATGSSIAGDPFTAGVASFSYNATSVVSGGTPLFFASTHDPFVAHETVRPIPEPTAALLFGAGLLVVARALRGRAA